MLVRLGSLTRAFAARCLSPRLRQQIKRLYYPLTLSRFPETKWPLSQVVKNLVHAGDTVVDVGANIGYVSLLLSRWVGPTGRVYSLEPVPETFGLLLHNVRVLRLENIECLPFGASERDGMVAMDIPAYADGLENYYEAKIVEPRSGNSNLKRVQAEVRRLDSLACLKDHRVSFVKIDAEGHEGSVIEGAAEVIRLWNPALLIEVAGDPDDAGSKASRLFARLARAGYSPYRANAGRLSLRQRGEHSVDYFFLLKQQYAEYTARAG